MTADYEWAIELAQELLNEFGRVTEFIQLSSQAADSDKPWEGAAQQVVKRRQKAMAAWVDSATLGNSFVQQDLLNRVNCVLIVTAQLADLNEMHAAIDINGSMVKFEWCRMLRPAEQVIMFYVGVNR